MAGFIGVGAVVNWTLTCATSLEVTPGAHPTQQYRAISGATRTRVFGSQPVGATITAQFIATPQQAADAFAQYHQTFSGAKGVGIPTDLFTGHEPLLAALPTNLSWHFAREPQASPQFRGRVQLSVEFQGRIEV